MTGRLVTAGIVVFWLVMMGMLVEREILPAWRAAREDAQAANYSYVAALAEKGTASQMGVYLKRAPDAEGHRALQRIGHTLSRMRKRDGVLLLEGYTEIKLSLSGGAGQDTAPTMPMMPGLGSLDAALRFDARVINETLEGFRFTVSAPPGTPPAVTVDGRPAGDDLVLTVRRNGESEKKTVPFDAKTLISSGLGQVFALPELRLGARWPIRTMQLGSYTVNTAWAEVVAREELVVGDTTYDAWRIEVAYDNYKVQIWADAEGTILKQTLFGFVFLREEPPDDIMERHTL